MTEEDFRELHHFETETKLTAVLAYLDQLEDWEAQEHVVQDIRDIIGEL